MSTTVEMSTGRLEGACEDGVLVFRGIPFARPPLGPLRFAPPQEVEPWPGVRDATRYGPAAVQTTDMIGPIVGFDQPMGAEDCLTLNVWTPATDGARRPVMVWIHGGAFTIGSGSQRVFDSATLARRGDTVIVTINYRLGAFGFLRLSDTPIGRALPASGNEGLLDQIAALEWVRREIARFGGDPGKVTIFGESAGSISCSLLLTMPRARGLFHQAILQSGPPTLVGPPAMSSRVAQAVLEKLGDAAGSAARLRELPPDTIRRAQAKVILEMGLETRGMPFRPCADGDLVPVDPLASIGDGCARDVPVLVGTTRDEMKLFALLDPASLTLDAPTLLRRCERNLAGHAQELIDGYRAARSARGEPISPSELWFAIESDRLFRIASMRLAELQRAHQPRTYTYCFTWESPYQGGVLGAAHALDIPFVFGTQDRPELAAFTGSGPAARALAERMQDAWLAFARTGDPAHPGLPAWPAYDGERRATMLLGAGCEVVDAPRETERRLWDAIPL
jgi:para-nitrobenzyl esterase